MRSRSAAALALFIPGATLAAPATTRMQPMQAEAYDGSAPLFLMRPAPAAGPERDDRGPKRVPHEMQTTLLANDPVLQDWIVPVTMPQMGHNFDGIGAGFVGHTGTVFETVVAPPDPQGDVGPSHYVQIVNSSFAIFAKDGRLLFGPTPTRTVFTGLGPPCDSSDIGDGVVLYDSLA